MARVHRVGRARRAKAKRVCARCGHAVKPGEAYYYWENRYSHASRGVRKFTCFRHMPLPSQTVASDKISRLLAIGEHFEEFASHDFDDVELKLFIEESQEEAEVVAQEYEDSAENIELGFGGSNSIARGLRERSRQIKDWAIDEPEWPDAPEHQRPGELDAGEDSEYYEDAFREWDEWRQEAAGCVREWIGGLDAYGP